jgi:hypothetical protein
MSLASRDHVLLFEAVPFLTPDFPPITILVLFIAIVRAQYPMTLRYALSHAYALY